MNDIHQDTKQEAPTVLLMHGAFAESASWNGVIANLQHAAAGSWRWRTRCGACRGMPPTCAASSTASPGPSSSPATPMAAPS